MLINTAVVLCLETIKLIIKKLLSLKTITHKTEYGLGVENSRFGVRIVPSSHHWLLMMGDDLDNPSEPWILIYEMDMELANA